MDTHKYTCLYCHEEFIPARRHVQKYCSDSCRSKAYHIRKRDEKVKDKSNSLASSDNKPPKQNHKKNSLLKADTIVSAAAANLLAQGIISIFTKDEDKTVTRKDFRQLLELQSNRFHRINNLPLENGKQPYFDLYKGIVVYKNDSDVYNFLPG
jgi:hypothetical protein